MKRRLLNLLTALSLLMCVAVVATWVVAAMRPEAVQLPDSPRDETRLLVGGGRLTFFRVTVVAVDPFLGRVLKGSVQPGAGRWPWRHGGFALVWRRPLTGNGSPTQLGDWTLVSVPFWALLALGAAPLSLAYTRGRSRRRRQWRVSRRLCPRCGYDLRATPDKCPECGTEAA
jgi:hypothetical protein